MAGRIGYAFAPSARKGNTGWLWAWALGIESSSRHRAEAFRFLTWATDRRYVTLVGTKIGWAQVPPGLGFPRTAIPRTWLLLRLPNRAAFHPER